jgi:hypothetical protein
MSFRPPTFRIILALAGASLVLWGAKGVVLNVPLMSNVSLFDISRSASWTLVCGTIGVLLLAWMRPIALAWLAWCIALGALAWMMHDLWLKVHALSANFAASTAAGDAAPDMPKIIGDTVIKPGAVAIASGLVIQAVALCLRHARATRNT